MDKILSMHIYKLKNYKFLMYSSFNSKSSSSSLFYWFLSLTLMTFFMIVIGGLTRLTDSGLSMVDWRPIMGFIPPLSQEDWIYVFNEYQNSPEFKIINNSMILEDFKYIFWWEWGHRFFARCLGIAFIIPMIIFTFQRKISKKLFYSLSLLFFFGLFQAIVGWWMVKSGLEDNPYVSSYRLAFHLTNAVIILSILFWLTLTSFSSPELSFLPKKNLEYIICILIFLLILTIVSGAFMAGSHAGQSFNTYPFMNGSLIPNDYYIQGYGIKNFFENTVAINFNHRWLATLTFVLILTLLIYLYLTKRYEKYFFEIILIFFFSCLQFLLGILTLLTNVKLILASLHQVNSMLLLATLLLFYYRIRKK